MPNIKQKRNKLPTKKTQPFDKSKAIMFGMIIGLVGILVTLTVVQSANSQSASGSYVSSTTR